MDNVTRLVVLSNLFKMCETIEELDKVRNDVRGEVKSLPRDCQEWILCEWQSARRRFDLDDIPEETLKQINEGKHEITRGSKKSKRQPSTHRSGQRQVKDWHADTSFGWEKKK